ncbi:site-specific DNA-methyltransferase [bacterium]|nr:site-specific DNA-methyltransferase [bacterium]MBU1995072.1 site-specific DNA-methyltransferase [bacterium]
MKKLEMQTPNKTNRHVEILKELFPHAVSESKIDFDLLRQILSESIVEGDEERYRLDWVGKKASLLKANSSINKTLRPCVNESVDFENTQNLYIEGDNFEVLKLLSESYLNKIKMIYIDPPYNTGKDFVYRDNFTQSKADFEDAIRMRDEEGNKLFKNTDSNGRFHSDWLSMMYERLLVARDLLKEDGVIFISIDDNEVHNLRKICDEVFGEGNFVGNITWEKRTKAQNTLDAKNMFQSKTEYILTYKKNINKIRFNLEVSGNKNYDLDDERGVFRYKLIEEMSALGMRGRATMIYPILGILPNENKQWKVGQDTINEFLLRNDIVRIDNKVFFKIRPEDEDIKKYYPFWSHFFNKEAYGTAETGKTELSETLDTKEHDFETVKPTTLIKKLLFHLQNNDNEIILDFFSGSATTAHAVMQLNSEDGGNRKFIMVQLPEATDEKSEAFKAGYKNICEIGKERIRRAGAKITQEIASAKPRNDEMKIASAKPRNDGNLDIGFRVLRLDTTNFKDVYYHPNNLTQKDIFDFQTNIKEERTDLDLLFQIMLDLGIELSLKITPQTVEGTKLYLLENNELIACLEDTISQAAIQEIKKLKPYQVVLKDGCFADDNDKINALQELASVTTVSVI